MTHEQEVLESLVFKGGEIAHHYVNTNSPVMLAEWVAEYAKTIHGLMFGVSDELDEE